MADSVYARLKEGPVPTSHLVRELRDRWGADHGVSAVHGFLREVATCLLWHSDVELGELKGGRYVPWVLEPEDANTKIEEELMSMDAFLEDESRYVFRKNPLN